MRVLIVEDEEALSTLLRYNLEAEGFSVDAAARGDDAELLLAERTPDLVLLDWMLPGLSGIELCRRIRARRETERLPVIMLTAKADERDELQGFQLGVDEYISKPFSPKILVARVEAILRRTSKKDEEILEVGGIKIDRLGHQVLVDEK